jgi:hypothetical protein
LDLDASADLRAGQESASNRSGAKRLIGTQQWADRACFGAMITTARHLRDVRPDDIQIGDLGGAGLARPCVIRLARLATFEWSDQVRRVGTLHRRERQAVARLLQRWLDI